MNPSMHTYFIDGSSLSGARDVHLCLKTLLSLPDYYGCNLDALNDCLSERKPIRLWVAALGNEQTAEELRRCAMVIRDNGGEAVLPE